MFDLTDWKLTSLAGMTVSAPTPIPFFSAGLGKVPMEFTNTVTGAVEKFQAYGGGGTAAPAGLLSRVTKRVWPGASFSPSKFPSRGFLYGLQMAKKPFDITQLRHRFGAMVDAGVAVGVSGSVGIMVFGYTPFTPSLLTEVSNLAFGATAVAACAFATSGVTSGALGPSADQFEFMMT